MKLTPQGVHHTSIFELSTLLSPPSSYQCVVVVDVVVNAVVEPLLLRRRPFIIYNRVQNGTSFRIRVAFYQARCRRTTRRAVMLNLIRGASDRQRARGRALRGRKGVDGRWCTIQWFCVNRNISQIILINIYLGKSLSI